MIFVDKETTGLLVPDTRDPEKQPGIVQIGILVLSDINPDASERYNWLCNPEKPDALWDPKAIETHHITPDMVKDAPTLPALFHDICRVFIGQYTWVGFNLEFDKDVLFYQLLRYNLHTRMPWPPNSTDVMKIAGQYLELPGKQGNKDPKLTELFQHFFPGETYQAHDALADVMATYRCWKVMRAKGWL